MRLYNQYKYFVGILIDLSLCILIINNFILIYFISHLILSIAMYLFVFRSSARIPLTLLFFLFPFANSLIIFLFVASWRAKVSDQMFDITLSIEQKIESKEPSLELRAQFLHENVQDLLAHSLNTKDKHIALNLLAQKCDAKSINLLRNSLRDPEIEIQLHASNILTKIESDINTNLEGLRKTASLTNDPDVLLKLAQEKYRYVYLGFIEGENRIVSLNKAKNILVKILEKSTGLKRSETAKLLCKVWVDLEDFDNAIKFFDNPEFDLSEDVLYQEAICRYKLRQYSKIPDIIAKIKSSNETSHFLKAATIWEK